MALRKLKLKLKTDLKKTVESGSRKEDHRFLPYFSMKAEQSMTVLLLPDENGELWKEYRRHGPNLKVRGVPAIRCIYEAANESCPACQVGFDALDLHRETGDVEHKNLAKKWFASDSTIMSCVVLDSPVEIADSPDGNEVKIFSVPYAVKGKIKQAVLEGEIDEDDLFTTPLVIKKTENAGGYASYEHSYFRRKPLTEEEQDFFEDRKVELMNYETLDVIPPIPTAEEIEKWVETAAAALNLELEKGDGEKDEKESQPTRSRRAASSTNDDEEEDEGRYSRKEESPKKVDSKSKSDPEDDEEEEEEPPKTTRTTARTGSNLRDRLRSMK